MSADSGADGNDLRTLPPERLVELIRRGDVSARRILVAELTRRRTEPSVRALARLLESESWHLRDLAVNALGEVGSLARPYLAPLLNSGLWFTRASAARVVGKIALMDELPRLIELLDEGNSTIEEACLASIADLVRAGFARETARLFWTQGASHSERLARLLLTAHPDVGGAVAEFLASPSSFLEPVRLEERAPLTEATVVMAERKNA